MQRGTLAVSRGVKQLWRWASHHVCGFVGICGRDEPSVLLLPAATAAKLDLVYVHDAKMLLFYTLLLSQWDMNSFTRTKQNRPFCDSHHIFEVLNLCEGFWNDFNRPSARTAPGARPRAPSGLAASEPTDGSG